MTTVHATTATAKKRWMAPRRRTGGVAGGGQNIIPSSTGAAKACK